MKTQKTILNAVALISLFAVVSSNCTEVAPAQGTWKETLKGYGSKGLNGLSVGWNYLGNKAFAGLSRLISKERTEKLEKFASENKNIACVLEQGGKLAVNGLALTAVYMAAKGVKSAYNWLTTKPVAQASVAISKAPAPVVVSAPVAASRLTKAEAIDILDRRTKGERIDCLQFGGLPMVREIANS